MGKVNLRVPFARLPSVRLSSAQPPPAGGASAIGYVVVLLFLLQLGLGASLMGCSYNPQVLAREELPSERISLHKVKFPNEDLAMIALWYTGSRNNWRMIETYNGQLKAPEALALGDIVRIPSSSLVRADPMPLDFVTRQSGKFKRARPSATKRDPPRKLAPTSSSASSAEEQAPEAPDDADDQPDEQSQDQLIENLIP